MDPSTSATCRAPLDAEAGDPHRLSALQAFYHWQAWLYDWTRPFILYGRREAVNALEARTGQRILDVGCGTGWSLPKLARCGAEVVGVEASAAMRARARRRLAHADGSRRVRLDPRPYATTTEYAGTVDRILLSYSLSMMPHYREVIQAARADLRPGGRIAVVDFLEATNRPTARWLESCHVCLGDERLRVLAEQFPKHKLAIHRTPLWRYYRFTGSPGG